MWRRFLALFRGRRLDEELSDEVEFHLAMLAEQKLRQGLSPEEARLAARREFGGVEQIKEAYREQRGLPFVESLLADCLYGLRMMRRNPLFTAVVVLTLTLGTGASTAVFSVAHTVLMRRLPEPERAVVLLSSDPRRGTAFSVAEGVFADWRDRAGSFEVLSGYYGTPVIMSGAGQPRQIAAVKATASFFELGGVRVIEGRAFGPEDERAGADDVVVLDAAFWRSEIGGRGDILGRPITLDDRPHTVIGVVDAGFVPGQLRRPDVWLPLVPRRQARAGGAVIVVGRLRAGIDRQAAQSEMDAVQRQVGKEHPEDSQFGVAVRPLGEWVAAEARPALLALAGAVGCLLVICCVNLANLMLARSAAREREFAIRISLGCGRARLARQVVVENLMLALAGGAAGFVLAIALVRAVPRIRGVFLPRAGEIGVDVSLMAIALGVTLACGILFSLAPAWRAVRVNPGAFPGGGPQTSGARRGEGRLRAALVVAQVALSAVLVCGAGLLLNTFLRLTNIDAGFRSAQLLTVGISLPFKQYDAERRGLFLDRLMEKLRGLPGVLDVSAADFPPLLAVHFPYQLKAEGGSSTGVEAQARHVAPRYFEVLGIPLRTGRGFVAADEARSPVPAVLNGEAARRLFGGAQPLGRRIVTNYSKARTLEVVGVAGDARQLGLKRAPEAQIYLPLKYGSGAFALVRVAPNAGAPAGAIRAAVFELDPAVAAPEVLEAKEWFEIELAKPRVYLLLLMGFAILGMALAAVGVYGVVAYGVSRRTHEFGVRMALGADRVRILGMVLGSGARMIGLGIGLGVIGGLGATRVLESLLYGVRPDDFATFAGASFVLGMDGMTACYLGARAAAELDPGVALRHE